jgi:hypothetical protein
MFLSKRYRELMDLANQAHDRQTYFYYLKQAEQLLRSESPEQYGIAAACTFINDQYKSEAA